MYKPVRSAFRAHPHKTCSFADLLKRAAFLKPWGRAARMCHYWCLLFSLGKSESTHPSSPKRRPDALTQPVLLRPSGRRLTPTKKCTAPLDQPDCEVPWYTSLPYLWTLPYNVLLMNIGALPRRCRPFSLTERSVCFIPDAPFLGKCRAGHDLFICQ